MPASRERTETGAENTSSCSGPNGERMNMQDATTVEAVLDHTALAHEAERKLARIRERVTDPDTMLLIIEYGLYSYRRGVVSRAR